MGNGTIAGGEELTRIGRSVVTRAISRRGLVGLAGGLAVGTRTGWAAAQDGTPAADATPTAGTPVGSAGTATVYSGRAEELVGSILSQCAAMTGVDAEVRYGDSGELAATLLEEGDRSPASLFFSQDAGLLGLLAAEGRLAPLPKDLVSRVDPRFRSPDGSWVGITGRARVLVYNTETVDPAELPGSVRDLTGEAWRGRIGWAPGNASFQAFVTALRLTDGDDGARTWLEGMIGNEAETFDGNSAIVRAVGAGELDAGLVNHYYAYEIRAEEGEDFPVANHFFAGGDPGSLVNVAGVGILASAPDPDQALALAACLLGEEAQTAFAATTFEYPLIEGVAAPAGLPTLAEIESPAIDLAALADLQGTLDLLTEVGLI